MQDSDPEEQIFLFCIPDKEIPHFHMGYNVLSYPVVVQIKFEGSADKIRSRNRRCNNSCVITYNCTHKNKVFFFQDVD